ncbi:unnamed protein product [Laminaria digitata]
MGDTHCIRLRRLFSDDRNEGPSGYEEIRKAFFDKFREVANKKQSDPDENVSSIEEESVRALAWRPIQDVDADADTSMDPVEEATSKFLRQLNDHGRAPWPALLKLSRQTRALEMGGMGLGDDLMAALAMVMPILRSVERLVAFDNRMTDFSLFRVVLAVQGMPSLTHLDLSENKIGALAAHELREYMRSSRCKLRSLAIRKADIDDDECSREFMAALVVNVSLLEVDLTENLIGMAAASKVTGADSIAAMLSVNCTLTSLNLGWNSIRMASAVTVAESLRDNHTLLSLGLAYNSFSDYASQILAVALSQNDTLTSLDLSYNSVSPAAAIVLAFALKANTTLKFVELEGNRIGRNGGEALVMAMRTSTRSDGNLIVSVKNCDTSYNDETLLNVANATGEYTLDLQTPYQKAVAAELLILANRKPTAHFVSLKHVTGKRVTNVKLRREKNAVETLDPGAASTRRIKKWLASGGRIEMGHFTEYARAVELKPEPAVASKLVQIWNEVLAAKSTGAASNGDPYGGDLVARSFFESVFRFADKDDKGELVVNDLKMLFQALGLPYGNARIRHVMTKYDADHSGSVDVEEFTHYMTATHIKQRLAEHGVLCTDDKSEWRVPDTGILRVHFVEEPNDDRTLGEMSTDCGVEGLIINIRQSPSDDSRKRLFELATANSRTYFTASQARAQGLLEAISSNYHLIDAVAILMPQLASTQECAAFIDSNLDHRAKVKLRFIVGGAWGAMMGMPSAHYALDMQSPRDRLTASKMAAVANHERQHSQFSERVDTSQHGNWHNFRNAEYKREPVVLTSGWFVDLPKYGVLRFDYVSTSRPDHHQMPLPERRFQRMLARLGLSTPITPTTPVDEDIITADALLEACTSHWRKMASSSPLYKIDMRDYFRSGSALDDVSLASWWSVVEVKSVDLDRKNSFAHLEPSDTYVKAWYKLKELEVALCSACLTTDQLARILESFPREGQIRAEVVVTFYHKVTDIDQMCLLVDALRPDESREVFTRRGFLNVTNPFFADRYYRLDLSVWDDREMAKILIRLAMMEPGENWIDETYERKIELGPLPGWELPLDWTTPDITSDKKEGGPRRFGILTLWYASTPRLGCMPNLGVRQDLAKRTLCSRADRDLSSSGDEAAVFDIVAHTFRQQQRFRSMLDKARQGMILLADEIAIGFTKDVPGVDGEGSTGPDTALTYCPTATSSLTEVGEEGELAHAWGFPADVQSF